MRAQRLPLSADGGRRRLRRRALASAARILVVLLTCGRVARADDSPSPPAERVPVEVQTRVEPKTVTIGTPFRYTIRVVADKDVEVVIPQLSVQVGEFEVTDFGSAPPREEHGRVVSERWYTLLTYTPGDGVVPGPSVQYRVTGGDLQKIAAPDAPVTLQSLLDKPGATPPTDVRDIKGPVAVPHDYRPLLWLGAALLGVVALVGGLYWLINGRRKTPAVPPRPAHEVALEALAKLHGANLVDAGRHEEFYVRLSHIVRTYLEARFHLRAPEMTTEEFLQVAQRDPQLAPAQRSLLGHFLSEADLVKFARYVPAVQDAERAYTAAREFVQSTVPPEVPRAAA